MIKTITQNIRVLCTKPWSAVVFSAMDFNENPPHVVGSHYITFSATENTQYHAGGWKNTPTIYSEKCKKNTLYPLYIISQYDFSEKKSDPSIYLSTPAAIIILPHMLYLLVPIINIKLW